MFFFNRAEHKASVFNFAVIASFAVAALTLYIGAALDFSQAEFEPFYSAPWFAEGVRYAVAIDGLSYAFVLLTALIFPLCILSVKHNMKENFSAFVGLLFILQSCVFGIFLAADLALFYVFFEASLIPMYLIVGKWGGADRLYAAVKFFLFTVCGSLLMLAAIAYIYSRVGSTGYEAVLAYEFSETEQRLLWLAFFAGFAVKIPMFPLHTWLPVAHVEAPTAGSVILAAILLKTAGYGFLRFSLPFFPDASVYFADAVLYLSLIAVIYASFVAFSQRDIKRLIAYSSVAHMGYVTMAIFTFRHDGLQAAIFQMISHGFVSAGLFFGVGVLYDRYHTRDLDFYGGLAKVMPAFSLAFMVFTMANVGLPGTSGFVGEFLTIFSVMKVSGFIAAATATAVIFSAAYGLKLYRKTFFEEMNVEKFGAALDLSVREKAILYPLAIVTVILGFYTAPVFDLTESAAARLTAQMAESL